jgi:hypothetical protein
MDLFIEKILSFTLYIELLFGHHRPLSSFVKHSINPKLLYNMDNIIVPLPNIPC